MKTFLPSRRKTRACKELFRTMDPGRMEGADADAWRRQWRTAYALLERLRKPGCHGQLLADDPGMGKTITALLLAHMFAYDDKHVVILAPNLAVKQARAI